MGIGSIVKKGAEAFSGPAYPWLFAAEMGANIFGSYFSAKAEEKMRKQELEQRQIETKLAVTKDQASLQYAKDVSDARSARKNQRLLRGLMIAAMAKGIMRNGAPASWSAPQIRTPNPPTAQQIYTQAQSIR